VSSQGKAHKIGWLEFGRDGSLYLQIYASQPIVDIGTAVLKNSILTKTASQGVGTIPLDERTGVHLSLHPSGKVHIRRGRKRPIVVTHLGCWLPVIVPFVFALVFTEAVNSLPRVQAKGQMYDVPDPGDSLRLEVVISPLYEDAGQAHVPLCKSTVCVGFSPRYAVLLNLTPIQSCEPHIFFLSG
jgi:hypothetical protein